MPTRASSNRCRQLRSVLRLDRLDLRTGRTAALVLGLILSFAFVSATVAQETPVAPPEEETPAGAAPLFGCEDTARRISGEAGAMQTVFCSAGCAESLWGTDVYTDDSSVCTAARHAGVIGETGGFVTVTVVEGQETYTGSVQNGVESWDYGSWDRSFSVAPAEELLVLFDCDAAGEDIAGEPGTTLVGACPPGCSGSLWGTDIYTDDSRVCIAAQHAGIMGEQGALVAVTILEGEESYTGSERNDVRSSDYEGWARSFSVAPADTSDEETIPVYGCWTTAQAMVGEPGAILTVICPAGCENAVWGTDIYTDDSSVCTAARHAGLLTEAGGILNVTILEGEESYTGSERNGVTSLEYGRWARSFSVTPLDAGEWVRP